MLEKLSKFVAKFLEKAPKPLNDTSMSGEKSEHPYLKTALAALAGVGTYAALRGIKPVEKITRAIYEPTKINRYKAIDKLPFGKESLKKFIDKMAYGADDVVSVGRKAVPVSPKKVPGTVLHEQDETADYILGKTNVGAPSSKKVLDIEDKLNEADFINKYFPKAGIESEAVTKNLSKTHEKFKDTGYFIKPKISADTGVGGYGFVSDAEIGRYLSGEKLSKELFSKVDKILKNPKNFLAQRKVNIERSPVFGQAEEFRIHGIGGDVVKGASGSRAGNVESYLKRKEAEKFFQEFLNKIPNEYRDKSVTWQADIAKTPEGFKLIETNAGPLSSGFLDPDVLLKGKTGPIGYAAAVRNNQAFYKHLTGRAHPLEAGLKGSLAAVGTSKLEDFLEKKNESFRKIHD